MALFNQAIDRFTAFLADQKANYILWLPVFVACGIAWYFSLSYEPTLHQTILIGIAPFIIATLCWGAMMRHWFTSRASFALACFIILYGLVAAGFTAGYARTHILNTHMIEKNLKANIVTGIITHSDHNQTTGTDLINLSVIKIENLSPSQTPQNLRIASRLKNTNFKAGDTIKALIALQPIKPPISPTSYDFRRHYYFEGIGGMGILLKPPEIITQSQQKTIPEDLIAGREFVRSKIEQSLAPRTAGIVTALMTGERAQIDDHDWDNLRASGLAHIISISGLHVAMVATSIFFVVRLLLAFIPFIALNLSTKKIAAFIALIGCILYVGFVVPTVPTTRSLLMTGIALIAVLLDRSPFSLRLVSLSALVILLLQPESLWSASFQLSFAAVTLLVVMADATAAQWNAWRRDAGFVRKIILFVAASIFTTITATIATSPFSSFHFGQIANYSVIANGLSIPLAGLIIMPMLIVSFLAIPFGLEHWPLKFMGWGVDRMLDVAQFTSDLPHAVTMTPSWPFAALLLIVAAGLVFSFISGRARLLAIIPLIIAFFVISQDTKPYLFISPENKSILVRDEQNNIVVSSFRRDKYARGEWVKDLGLPANHPQIAFPKEGAITHGDLNVACDRGACRITTPHQKITFGNHQKTLSEDCGWADVIITEKYFTPNPHDCKAIIYDRAYAKRQYGARPWNF